MLLFSECMAAGGELREEKKRAQENKNFPTFYVGKKVCFLFLFSFRWLASDSYRAINTKEALQIFPGINLSVYSIAIGQRLP